ncbi:hypothetical protein [Siansivirga zeaxanthinifaciens]|uniref:Lipoprotein n=1 Tax=Siansivirga zeaxanthinifaciens CC-SAMT-1 TaxID=1454006 RepID=A0A0C5W0L0_9FLAO|nr:hypothetical protein [Siansivirga zeaxanthinifaciens]AJR04831.1 hypothetical protein AW14_06770 [Siansivirga zeaxanthinifaciens CC-SAMT-1]
MKFINLIIIALMTFSCSNESKIAEFEKVLGKKNSQTLTFLVNDFENDFLKKQYPDSELNESYKKFLTDYKNGNLENWPPLPKKITEIFEASELKKEMYFHPDSVWILPNSTFDKVEEDSLIFLDVDRPYIKLRKKDLMYSSPDKIVYEYERHYVKIDSTTDRDSLINNVMNLRYVNYYNGKYRQATDYIRKFGGFFERFSDRKNIFNKDQICELILAEADLNDELVRKLIVLEFVL